MITPKLPKKKEFNSKNLSYKNSTNTKITTENILIILLLVFQVILAVVCAVLYNDLQIVKSSLDEALKEVEKQQLNLGVVNALALAIILVIIFC